MTANDERPDTAPHGTVFAPPYRAARIRALIGDRTGLTVDDLATVLLDTATPATALLEGVRRVVVEPDAANDRALDRARRTGFDVGPQVDVEHKRAQLAFLDRATLELMAASVGVPAAAS